MKYFFLDLLLDFVKPDMNILDSIMDFTVPKINSEVRGFFLKILLYFSIQYGSFRYGG